MLVKVFWKGKRGKKVELRNAYLDVGIVGAYPIYLKLIQLFLHQTTIYHLNYSLLTTMSPTKQTQLLLLCKLLALQFTQHSFLLCFKFFNFQFIIKKSIISNTSSAPRMYDHNYWAPSIGMATIFVSSTVVVLISTTLNPIYFLTPLILIHTH